MKSLLFTFLTLFNFCLVAQTIDPYKFFPSAVGNIWEYSGPVGYRASIYRDSLDQNGFNHLFYSYDDYFPTYATFKIDTANAIVYYTPFGLNWLYYKLDADSGDHWMVRPETTEIQRMEALVRAKYPAIFLGRSTTIIEITYYDLNWGDTLINQFAWPRFTMTIGYGIGEIMEFDEEGGGPQRILQGCIIDGDTIGVITTVKDDPFIATSFELFQNYPNPFNPSTVINYAVKEAGLVRLKVYDILGAEVAELVNEIKESGNHTIEFNASHLPSGVYIYTLQVNGFTGSKKMLLMK